jgi:microcystin-dependent protein
MPSTFTQNNRVELPAVGEQSGLWGETVNDNYDILDRVFGGVVTISLSSTTYTLTTDQASPSEGHYEMLIFSGTPGGTTTVTISPNTVEKMYFIRNTSNQTLTFTQGSGGNISIPASSAEIIYCDGAGGTAKVSSLTDSLTASSVAITGGSISGLSSMSVSGTVTATLFSGTGTVLAGTIILWSGAVGAIPSGWALCDGTSGTPDLRGRFVVGAGTGGAYAVGDTGGQNAITSVPAHTHSFSATTASSGGHVHTATLSTDGSHSHSGNTNTEGNHTHPILGAGVRSVNEAGAAGSAQVVGSGSFSHNSVSTAGGAHTHNVSLDANTNHTHTVSMTGAGSHDHTFTGTSDSSGSASVSILPLYYALCYIMRL